MVNLNIVTRKEIFIEFLEYVNSSVYWRVAFTEVIIYWEDNNNSVYWGGRLLREQIFFEEL